jgi:NAD(P)-dependent dehydrogenase (short-subunit alcohol dehydrogenase family)
VTAPAEAGRPRGALAGRVALVTGAGRGIGRAIAARLAADGAAVMAVARTVPELESLAAETGAAWVAADLASPSGCARAVEAAQRRFGPVDVLVNNAGIGSVGERPLWEQDPARWRQAMALNLDAPFELTRLALPGMLERRSGRIVMVASLASLAAGVVPGMSAYAASKHGLLGLMRAVAVETAACGITCNAVLPGSVRTRTADLKVAEEAAQAAMTVEEAWAARAARSYAGRLVGDAEVAAAVRFLVSEEASGVNGEALVVGLQPWG